MKYYPILTIFQIACAIILFTTPLAAQEDPPSLSPDEAVKLLKKVSLGDRGSQVLRFGDLNGDGTAEIISVQSRDRKISAVIAMNMDGKVLWQKGRESSNNFSTFSDLPVQVFDFDQDGKDEVLLVRKGRLQVLDGITGNIRRSIKVRGDDAIFIDWFGPNGELRILVKDRYKRFSVYNTRLRKEWARRGKTGHFPLTVNRASKNSKDLLVGYSLYSPKGKRLWSIRSSVKRHADGLDVGDMNGDGVMEIALAASGESVLLDENGRVKWRKPHQHSQHAVLGSFIPEEPGQQQAVFIDRAKDGKAFAFNYAGNQLWESGPHGRVVIMSAVDNWTGRDSEASILLFRRTYGPPVLLDGAGEIVARFPFLPAQVGETYNQHFAQHFDLIGDSREEILIHDHRELWIYGNAEEVQTFSVLADERLPNTRISNATFYTGQH